MKQTTKESIVQAFGPADWVRIAFNELSADRAMVLVMITEDAGSTPRDSGTWMLVGHDRTYGTLGGGQLEKIAEEEAIRLLNSAVSKQRSILRCLLGPDAQQCCGGAVNLAFELLNSSAMDWLRKAKKSINDDTQDAVLFPISEPTAMPMIISAEPKVSTTSGMHLQSLADQRPWLFLFGAGHVGCSVCAIASQLPIRVLVLDARSSRRALVPTANNVTVAGMDDPKLCVEQIPGNASALVMTHSHELDYVLCRALLERLDLRFIGLIGSRSKAARFRHRLQREGIRPQLIKRLTSPIGEAGPCGKEPGIIALSALSEIMRIFKIGDAGIQIKSSNSINTFS